MTCRCGGPLTEDTEFARDMLLCLQPTRRARCVLCGRSYFRNRPDLAPPPDPGAVIPPCVVCGKPIRHYYNTNQKTCGAVRGHRSACREAWIRELARAANRRHEARKREPGESGIERECEICGQNFKVNVWFQRQRMCSGAACQRERHRRSDALRRSRATAHDVVMAGAFQR